MDLVKKMKIYFKITIFIVHLLNTSVLSKSIRVVGGAITDIKEFPYLISLRTYFENIHLCGGAIISHKHIITAAHCIHDLKNDFRNLRIYTGCSDSISTNGPMFKVQSARIHPKYKPGNSQIRHYIYRYDIAVITVNGFIEFNEYQNKIELPTSHVIGGEDAIIAGWGQYVVDLIQPSVTLRKAGMRIINTRECIKTHPFKVGIEQVCAFQKIGVGVCKGDSGSPLVSDGVIIGVASFGLPCAQGISDVYTRVFTLIDFIRSAMV